MCVCVCVCVCVNIIYNYNHIKISLSPSWSLNPPNRVQILDEVVGMSYGTNNFGESMNPFILSTAIGE